MSSNVSLIELFNLEADFDEILRQYNKEYANLLENTSPIEIKSSIGRLNSLNEKLIKLNQKITLQINLEKENNLTSENKTRLESVVKNYEVLLREQSKIRKLEENYTTIYAENNIQTRNVNHQYSQYIFWFIISFSVIFLFCRLLFVPSLPLNSFKFFFWVIILSFLAVSLLYSYISTGFLITCLIIGYIILGFMKILPMP